MFEFISKLLSSSDEVSSKRVVTILAMLMICAAFLLNMFFDVTVDEYLYDSMLYIVISGLGFTASEYVFRSFKKNG